MKTKIKDMTDDEKRVKIAEFCGWDTTQWDAIKGGCTGINPKTLVGDRMPDYLNDLNAMRQAELSIPPEKRNRYIVALSIICGDIELGSYEYPWHILNATALQRAEAFIRII